MEHEDKPLQINNEVLGDVAAQTNAMAKALHYKEHEFLGNPSTNVVEKLIGINATLKQRDAALGLLYNEQLSHGINQLLWYEQLERYEQASEKYEERLADAPDDQSAVLGQMRCFHALSEWDSLGLAVERRWSAASMEEKEELAPMATASAWVLREWDKMSEYVNAMSPETADHSFFKAIILVHSNKFDKAADFIARARDALQANLGLIDDYNRVYGFVVF
jgi:FKBP12-rapamycin complex-associated protein